MRSNLLLFVIFAIFCANIGILPVFGEDFITVNTDKTSYLDGETITISGEIKDLYLGAPVIVMVKSPNGNLVSVAQVTVDADKKYSTQITTGGLMNVNGTYSILVQYWTEDRTSETFFEFGDTPVIIPPIDEPDYYTPVTGWDNFIKYTITGGKLLSITADLDENENIIPSLIISIEAVHDGSLILTIPRSVADHTTNGVDGEFIVLIDGQNVTFDETVSSTDRTLSIQFSADIKEIKIIGTYVVPEFGAIALMIFSIAVISTIVITAKFRIILKY